MKILDVDLLMTDFNIGRNCKVFSVPGFIFIVCCGRMIYDLQLPFCLYLSASDMLCYHL